MTTPKASTYHLSPHHGIGTLVTHIAEGTDPSLAHVTPIYQTATFRFEDVTSGAEVISGKRSGYFYTRLNNPNFDQFSHKLAVLEGLDLLRSNPGRPVEEVVGARVCASGMAAISTTVMALARAGDTLLVQKDLYGNTYNFFDELAPRFGLNVVWVSKYDPAGWEAALDDHPGTRLVYAETPANPGMLVIDLAQLAEIVHRQGAWLLVDNTFATPCAQRPLTFGADIVVHSTTKYLSGHGAVIGGAVISRHVDFIRNDFQAVQKLHGGVPGPMDVWLANLGIKTLEIRMQRHSDNALAVARFLESHPGVKCVHYPGLESDPGHLIARRQMMMYGGMLSFELKGGYQACTDLMHRLEIATLAVSLGNVDTLVQHPASMTHASIAPAERLKAGITDGLVRMSIGIENIADLLDDLEQALKEIG